MINKNKFYLLICICRHCENICISLFLSIESPLDKENFALLVILKIKALKMLARLKIDLMKGKDVCLQERGIEAANGSSKNFTHTLRCFLYLIFCWYYYFSNAFSRTTAILDKRTL